MASQHLAAIINGGIVPMERADLSIYREQRTTGVSAWVRRSLSRRHLPIALAVLAVVLTIPSLWGGWVVDDHHHRLRLTTDSYLLESMGARSDLFRFASGDEAATKSLMDLGIWPWWTLPDLRAGFWRPITSATHWLDYQLWPDSPVPMHAHSILWFAAMVFVAALLHRRMMGATVIAGLAALLYAIDDARGMPVGFLANRNALIAGFFGICAIIAHDRWRRGGRRLHALLAPVLFAAGLLSAEAGIGAFGYLLAHALFLDTGNWRRRAAGVLPYVVIIVAWRVVWNHLGYGTYGIGIYTDPLAEPLRFIGGLLVRLPMLLLGQFFFPPSETYLLTADFGLHRYYFPFAAIAAVIVVVAILRRIRWSPTQRFWAAGMFFSLIPACSAFPADRMLIFAGLGAFALLAEVLAPLVAERHASAAVVRPARGRLGRAFPVLLLGFHAGLAPVLLAVRSAMPVGPPSFLERIQVTPPTDDRIARQSLVVVAAPVPVLASWLAERCILAGAPVPKHTRVLAPYYPRPTEVERTDAHTLLIRPSNGFLGTITDQICRGAQYPMALGERVELSDMTAEVTALTDDGRPAEVAFRFNVPLENPSLRWLCWQGDGFAPFTPPSVGETIKLTD